MALKAGRVGVNPLDVDKNGHVTGNSITVVDNLNSTSSTDALSAKQGKVIGDKLGGFEFRTHEGEAQYRTSSAGEWENFSSGVVLPSIDENDYNTSILFLFSPRTTPTGVVNADAYATYSGSTLSDLIGTCDLVEILPNMYGFVLNAKSSSSSRIIYMRLLNDDTVYQFSTYSKTGNQSLELGNIANNVNISANQTGSKEAHIY